MTKKEMPLMVNFFSGWLDYPEYFFYWCYHGQNAIFNTMSLPEQGAWTRLIDAVAHCGGTEGNTAEYDKDVKGFVKRRFDDVPRIPLFQPTLGMAFAENVSGYQYWFHRQLDYRTLSKA